MMNGQITQPGQRPQLRKGAGGRRQKAEGRRQKAEIYVSGFRFQV